MKQSPPTVPAIHKSRNRLFITLGVTIGILVLLWGALEIQYQQRVGVLNREADKAEQDFVKPTGGALTASSVKAPHFLDSLACIDAGPCPMVSRDWLLLVQPGMEASLMKDILNREGFTGGKNGFTGNTVVGGQGEGIKGRLDMNLEVQPLGSTQPPYAAPAGRQWVQLYMSINDSASH